MTLSAKEFEKQVADIEALDKLICEYFHGNEITSQIVLYRILKELDRREVDIRKMLENW